MRQSGRDASECLHSGGVSFDLAYGECRQRERAERGRAEHGTKHIHKQAAQRSRPAGGAGLSMSQSFFDLSKAQSLIVISVPF